MSNDRDTGDEQHERSAKKRYFRVEEMHYTTDDVGLSHHIVATDMMHALSVLAKADLSDAVRVEVSEIDADQAALLRVHEVDNGKSYRLDQADLGDHFCEEY